MQTATQEALEAKLMKHPLVTATLNFTKTVLPEEHFRREDKTTPHIRHSVRTALLVQDYLDVHQPTLSPDDKAKFVSIALGHDSEEEPHERYVKNVRKIQEGDDLDPHDRGGLTLEEIKEKFDAATASLDPTLANDVYDGIHLFNNLNLDGSKKSDPQYLEEIADAGYGFIKAADRGLDSPQGDLSRLARTLKTITRSRRSDRNISTFIQRSEQSGRKILDLLHRIGTSIPEEMIIDCEATILVGVWLRDKIRRQRQQQSHLSYF